MSKTKIIRVVIVSAIITIWIITIIVTRVVAKFMFISHQFVDAILPRRDGQSTCTEWRAMSILIRL
jgi:hypothetical protein